jgi:hypothetical protein
MVSAHYEVIAILMRKLKDLGHDDPIMLQFDALDPETNQVQSIVTNVALKSKIHGDFELETTHGLVLRNITIKAELLYPHHLHEYDREPTVQKDGQQPFLNDLDHFSRYYETPVMFPNHYIGVEGPLPLKAKLLVGGRKVDGGNGQLVSVAELRLRDFDYDPCKKLLMQLVIMRAEQNSLGCRSENGDEKAT